MRKGKPARVTPVSGEASFKAESLALVRAIAASVRKHRIKAGLTQAKLAQLAGLTTETVSRFERMANDGGRSATENPTLTTLVRISAALGIDVSELFRK